MKEKKKKKKWVVLFTEWLSSAGLPTDPDELRERILQLLDSESQLGRELDEAQNTIVAQECALGEANRISQAREEEIAVLSDVADGYIKVIEGCNRELDECRDNIQRKDRWLTERDKHIFVLVALAKQLSKMVVQLQKRVSDYRKRDMESTERVRVLSESCDLRVPGKWLSLIPSEDVDNAAIPAVPETILAIVDAIEPKERPPKGAPFEQ